MVASKQCLLQPWVSKQDKTSEGFDGETEASEAEACPNLLSQFVAELGLKDPVLWFQA